MIKYQEIEGDVWKLVPGFPDYSVSNMGRFKSMDRENGIDNRGRVLFRNGRLLKFSIQKGYLIVRFFEWGVLPKKVHSKITHRIVAKEFVANPEHKPHVNHKNGNRK